MVIPLILANKRWFLIILLSLFCIGLLVYNSHLSNKLDKQSDKCADEKQAIIQKHKKASDKASKELAEMADKYETERLKEKVVYNEQKQTLREIVKNNVVYRDCKLDDSLQQKLREATTPAKY